MRTLLLPTLILGALATFAALPAAEPARPLAPTEIPVGKFTVLGEVADKCQKASGVPIKVDSAVIKAKCGVQFDRPTPLWEALQTAADASGARVVVTDGGRKLDLVPRGRSREVAATSGVFRVAAQQVVGRALLDQGITYHEVHLLVHWEPRVRVFRIDSAPRITTVTDVPGSKIDPDTGSTQILPLDATAEMKVKLFGLTRDSEKIKSLAGTFTVTAAEKMLAFKFASDGKLPAEQKQGDVSATLKRVQKKDDTWEVEVEVTYPPGQPVFQSFEGEWWLRDNRLVVHSANGKASFVIADYEVPMPDNPRPLRAVYRFKENPKTGLGDPTQKGWSIVYETPSPLADVKVPFELKDIPLP